MNWHLETMLRFIGDGVADWVFDLAVLLNSAIVVGVIASCFGSGAIAGLMVLTGALVCVGLFVWMLSIALEKITEV